MEISVQNSGVQINRLSYETFVIEEFEEKTEIEEEQTVEISAKIAKSVDDEFKFLFLFNVSITGKNGENILRKFLIDIFFEFYYEQSEHKNLNILKQDKTKNKHIDLNIFNYCQKEIENILEFNTGIGQNSRFSINDNIKKINEEIQKNGLNIVVNINSKLK
ncbi:hypothetical protein EFK41_08605 [Lactococcus lactis subsp. lactis]|uniref:hypothetical protein n=1 Tax=Lactococcus lactis TaxID=1358 RepID=UPI001F0F473F|nr:hypothetical protein [Lactococcus lactis]MCH5425971.1 hypothetical protein [Lactococcus lactis]MCT0058793.1 hypothetical protein [Lactococcus lactis subsp. lactis]